jgi:hypothetical protein
MVNFMRDRNKSSGSLHNPLLEKAFMLQKKCKKTVSEATFFEKLCVLNKDCTNQRGMKAVRDIFLWNK